MDFFFMKFEQMSRVRSRDRHAWWRSKILKRTKAILTLEYIITFTSTGSAPGKATNAMYRNVSSHWDLVIGWDPKRISFNPETWPCIPQCQPNSIIFGICKKWFCHYISKFWTTSRFSCNISEEWSRYIPLNDSGDSYEVLYLLFESFAHHVFFLLHPHQNRSRYLSRWNEVINISY